jgi:hypothetical protein
MGGAGSLSHLASTVYAQSGEILNKTHLGTVRIAIFKVVNYFGEC